ncbi:DUF998 domain-containing protein [Cellulomonas endophytica]|uniref:DUF998 domain-containing protein n=1 Tax=Cellulomonas endophytica TaxID=2494735 RepID=UPI0010134045|nr:DUF998 domain-containing protein [Cellulomonas endophytica]
MTGSPTAGRRRGPTTAARGTDGVPPWALASAVLAPVALVGGWTVAASREPGFDPVRETISALAATDAAAPAVMTAGLAVTGLAHVVTAAGLRPLAARARLLHAVGGVATAAVAALPSDVAGRPHGVAAGVAFVALAVWPAAAVRPGGTGPAGRTGAVAAAVLVGLLGWFVLELTAPVPGVGDAVGLSERALAGGQALWPLAAVLLLRRPRRPVAAGNATRAAGARPSPPPGAGGSRG